MSPNNQIVAPKKGPSKLERAKFGPGMLLQHEDLEQLNVYTRELSRLLFRSFFGCGVICGLVVSVDVRCGKVAVTVAKGVALDCGGDPIHVPQTQHVVIDEHCGPDVPSPLWVVLCGIEKCCAPRTAMCATDDDESSPVCTRERDWFEIRVLRERPECVCACPDSEHGLLDSDSNCKCANPVHECYKDHYDGKCGCTCGDCAECDCDCVLLARLDRSGDPENPTWDVDHRVRRFIRPVLMRDPQVEIELTPIYQDQGSSQTEADTQTTRPIQTRRRGRRQAAGRGGSAGQHIDPGDEDVPVV